MIQGGGPSGLEAIQSNAEAVSREARQLLVEARDTMHAVDAAIGDIRRATGELAATLEKVNTSILSEGNLSSIDRTIAHFEKASAALEPTLAEARKAITSVDKAAAGAHSTFTEATAAIEDLEPALREVPKAVAALSRAADQAAETLDQVESGEGLIGTLAYDREVSDDARAFIRNLKRDGLLRYRDKESETPEDDPRARFRGSRR